MKKTFTITLLILCAAVIFSSCGKKTSGSSLLSETVSSGEKVTADTSVKEMDFSFSDRDRDGSYDEVSATVISENQEMVEIKSEGTYIISGKHSMIKIEAPETAKIQLVLKNAEISNTDGPAVLISSADKVFLTVPEGTSSIITDGSTYSSEYSDTNIDGAVFSKSDLTLNGKGKLAVNGNYKCGVVSKDDLVIFGLTLEITSVGAAVEGKDCVKAGEAAITASSSGDGIKATNTEDASRGYVYIESGDFHITAANDGIQAETAVKINGGTFSIRTGGGSENSSSASDKWGMWGGGSNTQTEDSAKAIKASILVLIEGGNLNIDSSDDSIHSNGDTEINGGNISLLSGDDGIHADDQLIINGGEITAEKSYEGLEGTAVIITGGSIDISSNDDGINAAGGNDSSALGGRPGENTFNSNSDAAVEISGGYILINASGDGIDSNGNINITGGILLVSGPADNGNGGFDYASEAKISGGTAVICGSSGMAQGFSENSEQASFMYSLDNTADSGKYVAVSDSSGKVIASFLPAKQYSNIVVSSPQLKNGNAYTLSIGGKLSSSDKNGYTETGSISDAAESFEVEMTSNAVVYGNSGGMNGGFGGMGGERPSDPGHRR